MVEPHQILPGLFYATSYSSFSNSNQWYRVKVLKVNPTTVEVSVTLEKKLIIYLYAYNMYIINNVY